jgi:hypothetical protein
MYAKAINLCVKYPKLVKMLSEIYFKMDDINYENFISALANDDVSIILEKVFKEVGIQWVYDDKNQLSLFEEKPSNNIFEETNNNESE